MQEEGLLNNGKSSGYAFALKIGDYRGLKTVHHTGALAGYRAVQLRFPEQSFTVSILANRNDASTLTKAYAVADLYLADLLDSAPEESAQFLSDKPIIDTPSAKYSLSDLATFEGAYQSSELNITYNLVLENEQLVLYLEDRRMSELSATVENSFENEDVGTLNFVDGSDGEKIAFELMAGRVRNLRFQRVD